MAGIGTTMVGAALTAMVLWTGALASEPPVFDPPVSIFLGAGTGPSSVTFADFDGDGDLDAAVTLFVTGDIQLLRNTGAGYVVAAAFPTTGSEPLAVLTADLNNDGWMDLAWLNHASSEFAVARNAGTGVLATSFPLVDIYGAPAFCHALTSGDYDEDGFVDLAAADYVGHQVAVRRNDGTGMFPGMLTYALPPIGGFQPEDVLSADMDADGNLDLVTANAFSNNVAILLGNGAGLFVPWMTFPTGGVEPESIAAGDFDDDGLTDIAAACRTTDDVNVLMNGGGGVLLAPVQYWLNDLGTEQEPLDIDATDMDCDDDVDLATADSLTDNVSILTNDGTGKFKKQTPEPTGMNPVGIVLTDLNGDADGLPEVVTTDATSNSVTLMLNATSCKCEGDANGDGAVDPLDLGYIAARFGCAVGTGDPACDAADVNGDGAVDPLDSGFTAARFGACP